MILNKEQERESNRAARVEEFLNKQTKEYEARKPFNDEVQLLLGNIKKIAPLIPEKGTTGTTATKDKKALKDALAESVNEVCTNVTVYARSTGNKDLLHAVRYRASSITDAKDGDVQGIVTIITAAITPILTDEAFQKYEITADTLSSLNKQAEAFDGSRGKAAVIDTASSLANVDIDAVFKDIRTNVANLNLLVTWFNKTNPKFVAGYRKSVAIDYSNVRHSGIYGVVKNSTTGAVIDDASITLTAVKATGKKNTKATATNDDGAWEIIKFVSGKAQLTVSAPGCDTQVIPVTIFRGKITELNIGLEAKVINLIATA